MLSKEEIESHIDLVKLLQYKANSTEKALVEYIDQLESDKQKLIEKLEKVKYDLEFDRRKNNYSYLYDIKEILEIVKGVEMEEIEVNEYVRTKDGKFYQYIRDENELYFSGKDYFEPYLENIVKHSKQLIDLIEIEDIVNGCIVVGFGYECVNGNKEKSILVEGKYTKVNYALLNRDIETILTHEQFEQSSYKVGEKDE